MDDFCKGCSRVKEEDLPDNSMRLLSSITEFNDLHEFMQDEQLDKCLDLVVKLIMKPDVPPAKAVPLIVELQAISAKFAILGMMYQTVSAGPARSDNAHKKNLYYTLRDATNKLVDALKFSAKLGSEY